MSSSNLKLAAVKGLFWQFVNRVSINGFQFLIFILLARLLEPKDFGTLAILGVFINISNLLVSSGLGTALIQKRDADEIDFTSVFYISLFLGIFIYLIIYYFSPSIANYYKNDSITHILRLYSISIIFFSINGVQSSLLQKKLEFKKIFYLTLIPVLFAGILSILMAYFGYGVYALVANSLINGFLSVCLYSYYLKWFPKFQISVKKIKILFNFSYKILIANLIDEVYKNIYTLIIAKISSISTLGFYNYGRQIPNLIASTINATIASVAFPIYSKSQDDLEKIKFMVRKSIRVGNFVIFFLMCMIASTSTNLVLIVLTEKWLPCIKFLQIFSIIFAIYHIQSVNFHAISAIGKSNVYLKYETLKKIISISILLITFPFGIMAILYGQLLSSFLYIIINLIPNKKHLFYTYNEQLIDIGPFFLVAFLTFILIIFLPLGNINLYLKLLIQFIFGSFVYLALSKLFKIGEYLELYKLLLSFIRQDKK